MIRYFEAKKKIGRGTNSTSLALIPKEKIHVIFVRFGPISLCNASYEIIAKILANLLKNLLLYIVLENQGGFSQGKQIVDNILLAQKAIHSSKSMKEKGITIKTDMSNSFNRVRHSFLF